jgi:hypothetical protein
MPVETYDLYLYLAPLSAVVVELIHAAAVFRDATRHPDHNISDGDKECWPPGMHWGSCYIMLQIYTGLLCCQVTDVTVFAAAFAGGPQIFALGWHNYWKNGWNKFDLLLCLTG